MNLIRGSISVALASAALLLVGCSSSVTTGGNNSRASELSLEGGDEANSCSSAVLGDGVTCEGPDVRKTQAWESCMAQGLVLTDLSFAPDCADGGSTQVAFSCCAAPPPPPPPDPGSCTTDVLGDGETCRSPVEWKLLLSGSPDDPNGVCGADGLFLHGVDFHYDCADGASKTVKITCCPAPASPPDPGGEVCASGALGDGTTCQTADQWTAQVEELCATKDLPITDIGFSNDCPDGSSSYAKFICCAP